MIILSMTPGEAAAGSSRPGDAGSGVDDAGEDLDRMLAEARGLGANAVLEVRFATSMVMDGAAELLAYGTAVVVEDSQ